MAAAQGRKIKAGNVCKAHEVWDTNRATRKICMALALELARDAIEVHLAQTENIRNGLLGERHGESATTDQPHLVHSHVKFDDEMSDPLVCASSCKTHDLVESVGLLQPGQMVTSVNEAGVHRRAEAHQLAQRMGVNQNTWCEGQDA